MPAAPRPGLEAAGRRRRELLTFRAPSSRRRKTRGRCARQAACASIGSASRGDCPLGNPEATSERLRSRLRGAIGLFVSDTVACLDITCDGATQRRCSTDVAAQLFGSEGRGASARAPAAPPARWVSTKRPFVTATSNLSPSEENRVLSPTRTRACARVLPRFVQQLPLGNRLAAEPYLCRRLVPQPAMLRRASTAATARAELLHRLVPVMTKAGEALTEIGRTFGVLFN